MKNLLYAILALFGVLVAVIVISALLSSALKELEARVEESAPVGAPNFREIERSFSLIYEDFNTRSSMLSLLVADDTMLEIKHSFNDVLCYARAESEEGVYTSIAKLETELAELRDLAGLTLKSVF